MPTDMDPQVFRYYSRPNGSVIRAGSDNDNYTPPPDAVEMTEAAYELALSVVRDANQALLDGIKAAENTARQPAYLALIALGLTSEIASQISGYVVPELP